MRHERLSWITGTALLALLAAPFMGLAQEQAQEQSKKHKHYTLVDLGTLGGPNSYGNFITPRGTVVGGASTSVPDPICTGPWDGSCYYEHAFRWREGVLTDLGTLAGGNNSFANSINSHGSVFGVSENGLPDPVYGVRAFVGTIWEHGKVEDLGTLGGGLSWPGLSINDRGQAVGAAMNTNPDPDGYATSLIFGVALPGNQWHAVLWQNGTIQDLGTLGDGLDSQALFVNQRGQVVGNSYTDSIAHPETGIPTEAPFLWENGQMTNLGTLGGVLGDVTGLNNRGQVVGGSALEVNPSGHFHAFLWERGSLRDLGILGGADYSFSEANAINDEGEIAGHSHTADGSFRGFRWKRGVMTDLGSVPGYDCSNTGSINASGQIAGWAYLCDVEAPEHAVLWEKDGPGIDLNVFVPPGSDLELIEAVSINDRGEIAGLAFTLPDGFTHAFLLIPREGDVNDLPGASEATGPNAPAGQGSTRLTHRTLTPERLAALQTQFAKRHRFGFRPPKNAN